MMSIYTDKSIFITGGTGTVGRILTGYFITQNVKKIIIYSRDEYKQSLMRDRFNVKELRFFLGDIRDLERMKLAMHGADIVIHAAAQKQVESCAYNPLESVKTNIDGTANVIKACVSNDVKSAILISTDKVVEPSTFYGKTKAVAEDLWIYGNVYSKIFNVVRLGNIGGSRGSVLEKYFKLRDNHKIKLPLTHKMCTRFNLTTDKLIESVDKAVGGNGLIYIPMMESYRVIDLVKYMGGDPHIIGLRTREKIHERLISDEEACRARIVDGFIVISNNDNYFDNILDSQEVMIDQLSSGTMFMTSVDISDMITKGRMIYDNP